MRTLDVYGLYGESWQGEISDQSFAHPAKYSRALIRFIYQHCLENGYLRPGDSVVDPFGGVGLGARDALLNGLHWQGVELELRFQRLGQGMDCPGFSKEYYQRYNQRGRKWHELNICPDCGALLDKYIPLEHWFGKTMRQIPCVEPHRYHGNIERWLQSRFAKSTAQLIQGDSRQLAGLVCGVQACVGSPPYAQSLNTKGDEAGEIERLRAKGYDEAYIRKHLTNPASQLRVDRAYGDTSGQLGSMPEGSIQAAISSPPYTDWKLGSTPAENPNAEKYAIRKGQPGNDGEKHYGDSSGQLANLPVGSIDAAITSPPFGEGETRNRSEHQGGAVGDMMTRAYTQDKQGTTEGNLATLKADTEGYHAAVSSPPYANAINGNGEGPGARHDPIHHKGDNAYKKSSQAEYGSTPGNLGNMAASIGSPPYEASISAKDNQGDVKDNETRAKILAETGIRLGGGQLSNKNRYGIDTANIGNDSGETFWQAAKTIVEQVYMVLKPGGYSVWVCKNFVRNKQIVEFSDQWQALCEACGFVPVERIRAWVIEEKGTQGNLFTGEFETKTIERKSFFRRLAEKKGSPRIDWEDVIVLRKPE